MRTKLILQILAGATSYIAWAVMAFIDPTLRPDFLHFNIGMAMGTIGLVLRDMQPSAPPAAPIDKQSGHALPSILGILVIAALLAGCAAQQQAISAFGASAVVAARATNDNIIEGWTVTACATPLSAVARHPEIVPALKALCLPGTDAASTSTLLDGVTAPKAVAPAGPSK